MKNDKVIVKTKHLDMYKTDQGFYYCQRRTINSVAILCFKSENKKFYFLLRNQPLPQISEKKYWNQLYPCPITGSIEKNQTPNLAAINEVKEEGGFLIQETDLISLQSSVATSQMNEKVFYYLVDVTDKKANIPQNDGTLFESVSSNSWVEEQELIKILKNELHLASLLVCYYHFSNEIKPKYLI